MLVLGTVLDAGGTGRKLPPRDPVGGAACLPTSLSTAAERMRKPSLTTHASRAKSKWQTSGRGKEQSVSSEIPIRGLRFAAGHQDIEESLVFAADEQSLKRNNMPRLSTRPLCS